ncbi:MAG: hypothetical protein JNL70_04740 [Saprospiraceae bacterium]|nr:hypothetical protein [Saprospiraceae bacterium]
MATSSAATEKTITAALKKQATVLNKELLQASNELVDNSAKVVEKWQDLGEKVLTTGVKMLAVQQEVTLSAIETIVGQFAASRKRFNKLVGNKPAKKAKVEADTQIESDLTIDELMAETVAKPKKTTNSKKKTDVQVA